MTSRPVCVDRKNGRKVATLLDERPVMTVEPQPQLRAAPSLPEPTTTLKGLRQGLENVRSLSTVPEVLGGAPLALCTAVGFDCAAIFFVRDDALSVEGAYFRGDPLGAERLRRRCGDLRLEGSPWSFEMGLLRQGKAVLVDDRQPVQRTTAALLTDGTLAYVACPVIVHDRAIGFMQAARRAGAAVDISDREGLSIFCEGLALVLERAELLGRLRAQREMFQRMAAKTEAILAGMAEEKWELLQSKSSSAAGSPGHRPVSRRASSELEAALTKRELEVLSLMAAGDSNSAIAKRLVIAESTVKSRPPRTLRGGSVPNRWRWVRVNRFRQQPPDPTSSIRPGVAQTANASAAGARSQRYT